MRVGATICATICPCMPGAAGTFGALRRPLPRRVSVFDAFATPSWDYDFFLSSSLRLSRKEREGTCTPRAPRPNNCGVYGPDSVDPVRSWLMSVCKLVQSLMSQVSRCTPRHGCGERVCGSCPHMCVVRSWVRYDVQTQCCIRISKTLPYVLATTWYTVRPCLRCPRNASPG